MDNPGLLQNLGKLIVTVSQNLRHRLLLNVVTCKALQQYFQGFQGVLQSVLEAQQQGMCILHSCSTAYLLVDPEEFYALVLGWSV